MIAVGRRDGDDAAGLAVADRLIESGVPAGVRVVSCERPIPDLVELLRGGESVVLVDAVRSASPPGSVQRARLEDLAASPSLSSHGIGVREALALATALGRGPRRVEIVGIEAGAVRGDSLSKPVRGGVSEATALVRRVIDAWSTAED